MACNPGTAPNGSAWVHRLDSGFYTMSNTNNYTFSLVVKTEQCKYLCCLPTADLPTSLLVSPTRGCDSYMKGVLAASSKSHSGCIVRLSGLVQRPFKSVQR